LFDNSWLPKTLQQFPPSSAWPCPLHPFPIPQDDITAERVSFGHDWGVPNRNARGYQHTHTWELPGMHEIMGKMLGLLYTCPRGLLWWRRWKLGVTIRNFFFTVKFPKLLGSPTYTCQNIPLRNLQNPFTSQYWIIYAPKCHILWLIFLIFKGQFSEYENL